LYKEALLDLDWQAVLQRALAPLPDFEECGGKRRKNTIHAQPAKKKRERNYSATAKRKVATRNLWRARGKGSLARVAGITFAVLSKRRNEYWRGQPEGELLETTCANFAH
tara:strand:+ start:643 stop:972 length:330 start_codon:yes stop_codon:yes gene_type:complete